MMWLRLLTFTVNTATVLGKIPASSEWILGGGSVVRAGKIRVGKNGLKEGMLGKCGEGWDGGNSWDWKKWYRIGETLKKGEMVGTREMGTVCA
jgi:hypothetical protein